MRPRTPDEFVGQQHFFGAGKLLRRMLEADRLASVIFYGPPGTGKSALAHLIARATQAHWESVNAAASNVHEVREVIAAASTHAGEETAIIAAHRRLRAKCPTLLTVIAPRHPARGDRKSVV